VRFSTRKNVLPTISVGIPTLNRGEMLVGTIGQILCLEYKPHEIIVVDQTIDNYIGSVHRVLSEWNDRGDIIWVQQYEPSIPKAMNRVLMEAKGDVILFVDDDIEIASELIKEHASIYNECECAAVAGRVIQPWSLGTRNVEFRTTDPDNFLHMSFQ